MSNDDKPLLVALRATDLVEIAGSNDLLKCSNCEKRVWLAPTSMDIYRKHKGLPVICVVCFADLRGDLVIEITKEQIQEIQANLKRPSGGKP